MHYFLDAVRNGKIDTAVYLLQRKTLQVYLDYKDEEGQWLLHLAVASGKPKMVKFISNVFKHTFLDVNCSNNASQSPLLLAYAIISDTNFEIVDILMEAGAKSDMNIGNYMEDLPLINSGTPCFYEILDRYYESERHFKLDWNEWWIMKKMIIKYNNKIPKNWNERFILLKFHAPFMFNFAILECKY